MSDDESINSEKGFNKLFNQLVKAGSFNAAKVTKSSKQKKSDIQEKKPPNAIEQAQKNSGLYDSNIDSTIDEKEIKANTKTLGKGWFDIQVIIY